MKKLYIIAAIILSILLLGGYFGVKNYQTVLKKGSTTKLHYKNKREDGNTIAYGLKNINMEIIDNGSDIPSNKNKITVYVSLDHNIDEVRKYGLIILEDYHQKNFLVDNEKKEVNKYFFDMKAGTTKDLKVSLSINPDKHDLVFLLIKKPEYKLREMDMNRAGILEEVLSLRFSINKNKNTKKVIREFQSKKVLKDGLNENMFVTNSEDKLQTVITETEGKPLILSVGNDSPDKIQYAIIALKDWEQTNVINNNKVLYTTIPSETRKLFKVKLPEVEKESNFQYIAFPYPYNVSIDNYISQQAFGSFRILVNNRD